MTRRTRNAILTATTSLGILAVVAGLATVRIVQTDWFRNYITQKIISATQDATGGRVEVGSFHFDWRHLQADVADFVIHGNEPAGSAPFVRVPKVRVNLRLFTSIHHILDIAYLGIDQPEVNIIVLSDGHNNVPTPKPMQSSGKPPLQSIVNAAVIHFDLNNATIAFADAKQELSLHAENFRAELWFSVLQQGYRGELRFQPLYFMAGRNTPVDLTITLPVSIRGDSLALDGGTVMTSGSDLRIDATIKDLKHPTLSGKIGGHIALADLQKAGAIPPSLDARNVPTVVVVDADGTVSQTAIDITRLKLAAGRSQVEASGRLRDTHNNASLQFSANLALDEIGRMIGVAANPMGTATVSGSGKLDAANNYTVNGFVDAKGVSFETGTRRTGNFDLASSLHLDPHHAALTKLRVSAYGGVVEGDASLEEFARYQFHGNLRNLTLKAAATTAGQQQFPYAGTISGPIEASGDLTASNISTIRTHVSIAPGKTGIPVSGQLFGEYSTAANDLRIEDSYLALPHSRLNVNGSAGRQLNVSITTTDLDDFLAALPQRGALPVKLRGQAATFAGTVSGGMQSPQLAGRLRTGTFSVDGRTFDALALDATASRQGVAIERAALTHGMMQAQFSVRVGLDQWKVRPGAPLAVNGDLQAGDLADVLAFAGQAQSGTSGAISANVQVSGTVGNPLGSARIEAINGVVSGEPFDRIQAQVNLSDRLITVPSATVIRGNENLALSAELHRAPDSFTRGQLHVQVHSNSLDLGHVQTVQRERPNTTGTIEMNVDVTAELGGPRFQLTDVSGNMTARGLRSGGESYGDVSVNARSSGEAVQYTATSTFAGANIRINGSTQFQNEYRTSLNAAISNLPIERVLAAANYTGVPAKGTLSGTVQFAGTKSDPTGSVDLTLANAVVYDEPVDRLRAKGSYDPRKAVIEQLEASTRGSQIALTGQFDHPPGDLKTGSLRFQLSSNGVDLARIRNVQLRRPGLGGTLNVNADGVAELRATEPRIALQELKAKVAAAGLTADGKSLGDATVTADTQNRKVNVVLTSNLAGASIQGHASAQTNGDYPVDAQLSFSNVAWKRLRTVMSPAGADDSSFDAVTDGQVTLQGPAMKLEQLRGSVRLSRVELSSTSVSRLAIRNDDPVSVTLENGTIRIDSAHLTGPQSDVQAKGSFSLKDRSMNLTLNANADLAVLQAMDRDFSSSGKVVVATTVRGAISKPTVNGTIQLQKASLNYTQFPNGLSNANGTVEFNGTTASLRNLTAETGGGKLTLSGFVLLSENPRFGLRASASGVRVDVQQGVSIVTNGNIDLTGTRDASTLSGRAMITRINYAPKTDLGSILARAAPSVQSTSAGSPLTNNMKLNVQVQTSDALAVQSSLAQSLEGSANLEVRGTMSHPSVQGRVVMTGGTLTFFGSSYTVSSGTIAFYNPIRIEPILDVNLETNTKGVDVTLRVTGAVDNLKLSYTSDPPLQFEEIVGLLASGKTPTSDATLLANNPSPQQSYSEMGESALLGQALVNPVANRLQRVFGVTQLKIDPAFTNGSAVPQAQLTLQQQIASNLTFTYVTAVDNANAETIRVEVTLNPQWSAAAMRDENGIFSINLFYKRQFR